MTKTINVSNTEIIMAGAKTVTDKMNPRTLTVRSHQMPRFAIKPLCASVLLSGSASTNERDSITFEIETNRTTIPYSPCANELLKCESTKLVVYGNNEAKNEVTTVHQTVLNLILRT